MNAPSTFESFLLFEGEKKWVRLFLFNDDHILSSFMIIYNDKSFV